MSAEISQSSLVEAEMNKSIQPVANECWATLTPLMPTKFQTINLKKACFEIGRGD